MASLATMIGFARMGSALFWTPQEVDPAGPFRADRGGIAAVALCLAALAALTLFAGPVTGWLDGAAQGLARSRRLYRSQQSARGAMSHAPAFCRTPI